MTILVGTPGVGKVRAVARFSDGKLLESRLGGFEVFDAGLRTELQPTSASKLCTDKPQEVCGQVLMLFAPGAAKKDIEKAASTVEGEDHKKGTLEGLVNLPVEVKDATNPYLNVWQVKFTCKTHACMQAALAALQGQVGKITGLRTAELDIIADPLDPTGIRSDLEELSDNEDLLSPDKPTDTFWPLQWGAKKIKLPGAWATNTGDNLPIIAIVDSGIDRNFNGGMDFKNVLGAPRSRDLTGGGNPFLDSVPHATNVAGVAAATGDNKNQIAGASWGARLASIKIFPLPAAPNDLITAAAGLRQAVLTGASIINASWSFPADIGHSEVLAAAVAFANRSGRLLVSTAGNLGNNVRRYPSGFTSNEMFGPPAVPRMYNAENLVLGATDGTDRRATFSTFGEWVPVLPLEYAF